MKNLAKLVGIIAFVGVIGFSMTACDNGSEGDDNKVSSLVRNGQTYFIRNFLSQKVIDVDKQSTANNAAIHLWDFNGQDSQQWRAVESKTRPGYFSFVNVRSGMALDDDGTSPANNTSLVQWEVNGYDDQFFRAVDNDDGSVSFYFKPNETLKLSTSGTNHVNGTVIILSNGSGTETKWSLESVL